MSLTISVMSLIIFGNVQAAQAADLWTRPHDRIDHIRLIIH